MTERPILFSGPMVRAILEGRKTQTRRFVKLQPAPNAPHDGGTTWVYYPSRDRYVPCGTVGHLTVEQKMGLRCPYGAPGNHLWLREAWHTDEEDLEAARAQHEDALRSSSPIYYQADDLPPTGWRWRPAIHMPRWACRAVLEVTGVRMERLQDISEEDAQAEGVLPRFEMDLADFVAGRPLAPSTYRLGFQHTWDSLNHKRCPWASNPWCWVVSFRRVQP